MLHEPPADNPKSARLLVAAAFAAFSAVLLAGTFVVTPAESMDKGATTAPP
jgi:hypothetical protein